jgi:hypothetical protein
MRMISKTQIYVLAGLCIAFLVSEIRPVAAIELLINGNFETGNLSGWTASTQALGTVSLCCDNRFANGSGVSSTGSGGSLGSGGLTKISGNYSVFGDFDGGTSVNSNFNNTDILKIGLTQSFAKTGSLSSATLSFDFQVSGGQNAAGNNRPGGVQVRTLTAGFDAGGVSDIAYTYDVPDYSLGIHPSQHVSLDVTALLNSLPDGTVTFDLERMVPQSFTSPGYFVGDNFSLQVAQLTADVPEPSTWAMMILGFAGVGYMAYRRKSKPAPGDLRESAAAVDCLTSRIANLGGCHASPCR